MSLVFVARLTNGRPCSRFRTKPAAAIEACRQVSFIGPAIQRGTLSSTRATAAHVQQHDEGTWRTLSAVPLSSPLLRFRIRR